MTKPAISTDNASAATPAPAITPALIVLGRDDTGKAHASWFGEADAALATKAAGIMGMAALPVAAGELHALASHLPRGRVFASGRAFVPFVKAGLFDKLSAHLPKGAMPPLRLIGDAAPQSAPADAPADRLPSRQPTLPQDWTKITPGSLVLARESSDEGWFETRVLEVKADGLFVLKWRDWPELPKFVRRTEHLALLHPSAAASA